VSLIKKDEYLALLNACTDVLEGEDQLYRPRDEQNRPGGLVRLEEKTTMVVPDLHARIPFLQHALAFPVRGRPFFELMEEGEAQMVCVGDGLHSESRGYQRWQQALKEFIGGFSRHKAMDQEMEEGLGLMELVMRVKCASPRHFHFLKGNHENILNEEGNGNHPFRKYAYEGEMVRSYLDKFYGDPFLQRYAAFERLLPLLAVSGTFLISHAQPKRFFDREEIIRYRSYPDVVYGFTWTDNDEAEEESVKQMLQEFCPGSDEAFYFGGHRVISGTWKLRADGRYVQLHNPDRWIVAILEPGEAFDPHRDITELDENAEGVRMMMENYYG
jgi:hypothetical protein